MQWMKRKQQHSRLAKLPPCYRIAPHLTALLACGMILWVTRVGAEELSRYTAVEPHMGTQVRIVVYAANEPTAQQAMRQAFDRFADLEKKLSDYNSDSEVMRLCASAPHPQSVPVSDDLWRVIRESVCWSERTDGAFDVSVGPLSRLWRRARRQKELPEPDLLAAARNSVGYKFVHVHAERPEVQLLRDEMRLDFGGIAKGFAAQEAVRIMSEAGVSRSLVDAGGDIAVGSAPPDSSGWRVGVASVKDGEPPRYWLHLQDCVIATSGDLWQFLEVDGQRYSHILDPRTGMGVTRRGSATVIAKDGCAADALASAACVLGPEKALPLIEQFGATALLLTIEDEQIREHRSLSFAPAD